MIAPRFLLALAGAFVASHLATAGPAYFEFRVYDVTSNKLDAVVERFRETVEPVRRRHAIDTLGYWVAAGVTNGGKFVYLMTAPSKEVLLAQEREFGDDPDFKKGYAASSGKHGKTVDRIVAIPLVNDPAARLGLDARRAPRAFELRIYSILPGRLRAFRERWRDHVVPIYERHGLHSVGGWVAENQDAAGQDRFVCLLAGESFDSIQRSIAAFHEDPEWQRIEKETEKDGKLRSGVVALRMTPTDFSKLR